jgi:hypothetical protein
LWLPVRNLGAKHGILVKISSIFRSPFFLLVAFVALCSSGGVSVRASGRAASATERSSWIFYYLIFF